MCWITLTNSNSCPRTADDDIIVYKTMTQFPDFLQSQYRRKRYHPNEEYRLEKSLNIVPRQIFDAISEWCTEWHISEGFHSYSGSCKCQCPRSNRINVLSPSGIQLSVLGCPNEVIVQCVIPKGSTYYENELGCVVSDRIRITDNILHLNDALPIDEYKPFKNLKFKE